MTVIKPTRRTRRRLTTLTFISGWPVGRITLTPDEADLAIWMMEGGE